MVSEIQIDARCAPSAISSKTNDSVLKVTASNTPTDTNTDTVDDITAVLSQPMPPSYFFKSDNTAGAVPEVLDAIVREASTVHASPYGFDDTTEIALKKCLEATFGRDFSTEDYYCVQTGTAANCMALKTMTPFGHHVVCADTAHIVTDECGAPEFIGEGMAIRTLPNKNGKLELETLSNYLDSYLINCHRTIPRTISITNPTEFGTVYTAEEVAAICEVAKKHNCRVHVDGARFGCAVASTGASPAELTWKAGVSSMSLGLTKLGAMLTDMVVFFDEGLNESGFSRRKRASMVFSKMRFLSCQAVAMLTNDLWLKAARNANEMCRKLAVACMDNNLQVMYPVETNEIFVRLPESIEEKLRVAGVVFYIWSKDAVKPKHNGAKSTDEDTDEEEETHVICRFVTSFATTQSDVDAVVSVIERVRC